MNKEMSKWNNSKWISFSIYILINLGLIFLVVWWAFITKELDLLVSLFEDDFRRVFYLITIMIGLLCLSNLGIHFSSLFYPENDEDRLLKRTKKLFSKKYPKKVAELYYKRFVKEMQIKKIEIKLKEFKK